MDYHGYWGIIISDNCNHCRDCLILLKAKHNDMRILGQERRQIAV